MVRTLHIGCLWPSERSGGADRVLADLGKYLSCHGVHFEAIVAGADGAALPAQPPVTAFADDGVGTRGRWIGARRAIRARLDAGDLDLVVSHFAWYASAGLDWLRRVPHVVHFHGPWAAESRQEGAGPVAAFTKWCIERMVYASAARVIVLSEAFAAVAERDYGVPRHRLRIVPGAADFARFSVRESRAEARTVLGWPADRRIVLSVRRLVHRTGVDLLIDALPAVINAHPDVLLCIGGTGPMQTHLRQRIEALGLGAHVRLLGYVPDDLLALAYRAADVNVVPTRALEGFGLTAVESLAVGTPTMVTPVGGLPEVVRPLDPGLVFPSADADGVATGLIDALHRPGPLVDESVCRHYARQHFSAETMARRVAEIYREVCGSPKEAARAH